MLSMTAGLDAVSERRACKLRDKKIHSVESLVKLKRTRDCRPKWYYRRQELERQMVQEEQQQVAVLVIVAALTAYNNHLLQKKFFGSVSKRFL